MFDIQKEIKRVHVLNEKWWTDVETGQPIERNEGELFMLIASELAEAIEGERKNLKDDKLPQYPMAGVEMVDFVIRILDYAGRRNIHISDLMEHARARTPWNSANTKSNKAELIWKILTAFIRSVRSPLNVSPLGLAYCVADARLYCELFGYPFEKMYEAKFKYNETRPDHTHESRRAAHGKKF